MKGLYLSLIVFTSFATFANQAVWQESLFKEKQLSKLLKRVEANYSDEELQNIFSLKNLSCESKLIMKLGEKERELIIPTLILAHKKSILDEVETDLLMGYAKSYNKVDKRLPEHNFRIRSGKKRIQELYERLVRGADSERFCLSRSFQFLDRTVSEIESEEDPTFILQYLNHFARKKKFINAAQFYELEMIRHQQRDYGSEMSLNDYYRKRSQLQRSGYSFNNQVQEFHIKRRLSDDRSYRTDLYTRFSEFQYKKMLELIDSMETRTKARRSQIVFTDRNDDVVDSVRLSQTEKLRTAIKLYKREKGKLLKKDIFAGVSFTHRHLIALAYELGKIDDVDLAFLSSLEKEIKKRGLFSKVIGEAQKFTVLASLVGGPTTGFIYSLAVSMVNGLINGGLDKKPSYGHDLLYGNCEGNL